MDEKGSLWKQFIGYFQKRRWLVIWICIFTAAIILLALTGQIHTQGDHHITIYEVMVLVVAGGIWCVAKFIFKKDLTEEILLGMIFGIQWEFLTWPYWTYLPDKFNYLVGHPCDMPLVMLPGWGTSFALMLLLSNYMAMKIFKIDYMELIFDWRILICDAIAAQIIGTGGEWLYGIYLGCWEYNMDFGMGTAPTGLGWEIHIGYMIVIFWYGTTMRVWKRKLEGTL